MAKSGDVHRDVRGKRTYRVWVPARSNSPERIPAGVEPRPVPAVARAVTEHSGAELDYDELASTLLARVTRLAAQDEQVTSDTSWARRRLERLETQNAKLERELARLRGEAEMNRQQRDALQTQLDAAQHNLSLLTDRMGSTPAPRNNAANHLDADERALLRQLGGDRPVRRDDSKRVG